MIEYHVILKRYPGSSRQDKCIFRDEDREKAIREMTKYCKQYGFAVKDPDGWHTVSTIQLVAKEPIVGAPVISCQAWHELFDYLGKRRENT